MKLREIIEKKISGLYVTYEELANKDYSSKLKKAKQDFMLASEYLDDISKDPINIIQLETSVISYIVSESNWEMINEQLRNIKAIYEAKKSGLNVQLANEQREFYSKFIVSLQQRVEELNSLINYYEKCVNRTNSDADTLENDISALEELLGRLIRGDNKLTRDDFDLVSRIFINDPKLKDKTKKNVLKEFIIQANSNKKEQEDLINFDDVKALLKEYGVLKETVDRLSRHKEEIVNLGNIDRMREILDYLALNDELTKKRNIINSFGESVLISILLNGDVEHIKKVYNYQIEKYGKILGIYLDTPAFWINNISSKKRHKKNDQSNKKVKKIPILYEAAHETSIEDMELNEEFLNEKGFIVSIANGGNVKTLKSRHFLIRDNYQIYQNYGVIDEQNIDGFPLSALTFTNVLEHLDILVELGLLDDYLVTERPENSYAIMYPSIIQNLKQEYILFLYHLKSCISEDEYYEIIVNKNGTLAKSDILTMMENEGLTKSNTESYKEKYFVVLSDRIANYGEYLNCIYKANLITYDEAILSDPLIKMLESNHKVTNYSYIFGNQVISRLKVLRYFTALRRFGYIDEDSLLFCITYGSYIDENAFRVINGSLNRGGQR